MKMNLKIKFYEKYIVKNLFFIVILLWFWYNI